jgi:hypothetical protein
MNSINLKLTSLSIAVLLLASCGGEKPKEEGQEIDTTAKVEAMDTTSEELNEVADFKFHVFIANIPSPLESMVLIPDAGVIMDKTHLNSVENADKYTSITKKALNYGVYGADLGYLVAYEQNQDISDYFATLKSLAEDLGASGQFDKVLNERFQANLENRDSLLVIMDKALGSTEDYLKNNQRLESATLMLTGSWVESQFILVRALIEANGKGDLIKLYAKIPEQKAHLKSLTDLLAEQKSKDCTKYKAELEKVKAVYDGIANVDAIDEATLEKLSHELELIKNMITGKK